VLIYIIYKYPLPKKPVKPCVYCNIIFLFVYKMVKIVNGQIISDGSESPKSPFTQMRQDRPRRSSIQDLQLAEQLKERLEQKAAQEAATTPVDQPAPTWRECISEKISVFGIMLAVKHLFLLALGSVVLYGVQGLLVCLLSVYLGTLYKPKQTEEEPQTDEKQQNNNTNTTTQTTESSTTGSSNNSPLLTSSRSPSPTSTYLSKRRFSTLSDLSVQTSA